MKRVWGLLLTALLWSAPPLTAGAESMAAPSCVELLSDGSVPGLERQVRRELAELLTPGPTPCAQAFAARDSPEELTLRVRYAGCDLSARTSADAHDAGRLARVAGLMAAALLRQCLLPPSPPIAASAQPAQPVEPAAASAPPRATRARAPTWRAPPARRVEEPVGSLHVSVGGLVGLPKAQPWLFPELRASVTLAPTSRVAPRLEVGLTGAYTTASAGTTSASLFAEGGLLGGSLRVLAFARTSLYAGLHGRALAAQLIGRADDALGRRFSRHVLASVAARVSLEHVLGARASVALALDAGYVVVPLRVRAGDDVLVAYGDAFLALSAGVGTYVF